MKPKIWHVWIEEDDKDIIYYTGNRKDCLEWYKSHGGSKAGYHLGYFLEEYDESR